MMFILLQVAKLLRCVSVDGTPKDEVFIAVKDIAQNVTALRDTCI